MSWNVLQSASPAPSGTVSSVAATYTANLSSGSKLIAFTQSSASGDVATVADGSSNQFTKAGPTLVSGSNRMSVWVLDTPSGDVGTKPVITATLASGTSPMGILVQEVSGLIAGTTPFDGTYGSVTGTGGTTTGSPTYSSTGSGEYLVSFYADDGGGGGATLTVPSGYTLDAASVNSNNPGDIGIAYLASSGGAEASTWTRTSTGAQWGVILVAFLPASATPFSAFAANVDPPPRPPAWSPWQSKAPGGPVGEPFQPWPLSTTAEYPAQFQYLPVQVVQSTQAPPANASTITFTLTAPPEPGNLLVAFCSYSQHINARTIAAPSGAWATVDNNTNANTDSLATFTHPVQQGDGAGWVFTVSGASTDDCSGVLYELSGAQPLRPGPRSRRPELPGRQRPRLRHRGAHPVDHRLPGTGRARH